MLEKPLKILYLEDSDDDVELVQAVMEDRFGSCWIVRAETRESFESSLGDDSLDLILSDYSLPSFDGLTALSLARTLRPDLPFVMISGTLSETLTKECLAKGATDFASKHQYALLPSILRNALEKSQQMLGKRDD
jgi:CheY-like chemotaxis protein